MSNDARLVVPFFPPIFSKGNIHISVQEKRGNEDSVATKEDENKPTRRHGQISASAASVDAQPKGEWMGEGGGIVMESE